MIHKSKKRKRKKLWDFPYNMVVLIFGPRNYGGWGDQNGLVWQFKGEIIFLN
jgi:hypothetical protein